jgi:hypothetical protein
MANKLAAERGSVRHAIAVRVDARIGRWPRFEQNENGCVVAVAGC